MLGSLTHVSLADIAKGRVLMMMPSCLKGGSEIGAFEGVNPLGGNSPHYFMCIGVEGEYSYWCPLSSNEKPEGIGSQDKQGQIASEQKLGFPHWQSKASWYDGAQVWKISNNRVLQCADTERSNRRQSGTFNVVSTLVIDSIFPGAKFLAVGL